MTCNDRSNIWTPHVTLRADDFEVSIFLTETTTRHSLVTKHKHFHDTTQTKLTSNSGRLIGETNNAPVDVDAVTEFGPIIRREESDDEDATVTLAAIPAIYETAASDTTRRSKRARSNTGADASAHADAGRVVGDQNNEFEVISDEDGAGQDDDGLFVQSPLSETSTPPPAKRQRAAVAAGEDEEDDKKKLAMDISYEGFSIYGRVLCLVVKRRDSSGADMAGRSGSASTAVTGGSGSTAAKTGGRGRGQTMMENFIISTQIPAGTDMP
jgi:hypothetical protein